MSTPALIKCSDGEMRLGYLDMSSEIATVGFNGKTERIEGGATQADNRQLKTETGPMFQYVALWYKHGEPVFGRAFPDVSGKVIST
uniref:Lipoprotein n=1 Tax=Heterorhabditis bacteriophora TaxID=37862 RepID=A0A1I7X432_HETBA